MVGHRVDASDIVRSSARWKTITGPPGSGKSVLALDVAHFLSEREGDLCKFIFVNVNVVLDIHGVAGVLCSIITELSRVRLGHCVATDSVDGNRAAVQTIIGDEKCLLVLDNCAPSLSSDIAQLVSDLLRSCGNLSVLTTSVRALRPPEPCALEREETRELLVLPDDDIARVFMGAIGRPIIYYELDGGIFVHHPVIVACNGLPGLAHHFALLWKNVARTNPGRNLLNDVLWRIIRAGGPDADMLSRAMQSGSRTCVLCVVEALPCAMLGGGHASYSAHTAITLTTGVAACS